MIRLGLTGWPVAHSLSPLLQNAALRASGLDGEYKLYPAHPAQPEVLSDLVNLIRTGELDGLNITTPHKQTVVEFLDELTDSARAIGAVNTLYAKNGRLIGHNTDAPGFIADLRNKFFKSDEAWNTACSGNVLVLGAGGSALAVVWALALAGWSVTIASRRVEQAADLVSALKQAVRESRLSAILLTAIEKEDLANLGLIVNTTSAGMTPDINSSSWPTGLAFPVQAYLYDLVYNPRETLLVQQAQSAGLQAVTGLGMLIEQAALGFEVWTGHSAPREKMALAVEA